MKNSIEDASRAEFEDAYAEYCNNKTGIPGLCGHDFAAMRNGDGYTNHVIGVMWMGWKLAKGLL